MLIKMARKHSASGPFFITYIRMAMRIIIGIGMPRKYKSIERIFFSLRKNNVG